MDVELRQTRTCAKFFIWASPGLKLEDMRAQYLLARDQGLCTDFYFVVTPDRICGWWEGGDLVRFDRPAREILGIYLNDTGCLTGVGAPLLGELLGMWLDDLRDHRYSGSEAAPGEEDLRDNMKDFLQTLASCEVIRP